MPLHPMIDKAQDAVKHPEVMQMIQKLSEYGLGVFMPHVHTEKGFEPMPKEIVQLESDLMVEFLSRYDPKVQGATPVGWIWDEDRAMVTTACMCTGVNHDPDHWTGRTVADFN